MQTKLLVIGAIIAMSAMVFMVPTATSPANAACNGAFANAGNAVACAGKGAFAQAGNAIAIAFKGFAAAFIR